MRMFVLLVVVGGCDGEPPQGNDASTGTGEGLSVTWSADPALPGAVTSEITVSAATFALERLQVVGDAGPGDPRTTQTRFAIAWDDKAVPERSSFPDAPPGLYSRITFDLGATEESAYEILGEAEVNGSWKPFHIRDAVGLRISFECEAMLQANSDATVAVRLRLDQALEGIEFELLEDHDGVLTLDEDDPQITEFRSKLVESFELDNP